MAQARVDDFFGTKKRSQEINPSKRRKVEPANLESKTVVANETTISSGKSIDAAPLQSGSKPSGKTPATKRKPKATTMARTRGSARKKHALIGQVTIQDAFAKVSGSSSDTDSQGVLSDAHAEPTVTEVTEEVTSYWDEHDGARTPKHKTRPSESMETPLSDCREIKPSTRLRKKASRTLADDSVTPKKDVQGEEERAARGRSLAQSFRKMMAATPTGSGDTGQKDSGEGIIVVIEPFPSCEPDKRSITDDSQPSDTQEPMALPSDEDLAQLLKPVHPVPISPLPPTPQGIDHSSKKTAVVSSKIRSSAEKLKELQKDDNADQKADDDKGETSQKADNEKSSKKVISPEEMRERLAKCGKLDILKAKLAEMNNSLKAVQKREAERKAETAEVKPVVGKAPAKAETLTSTEKKPAPAYERYEHLAREGPPALALPGKYQRLLTMFQGTDTVVSMLFNRQETITFSKLKNAVQSMTKKNFEQKSLGQMKTVYPDAYIFRQEKGLPSFGHKVSGYQLTVEPNREGLSDEGLHVDKKEKATMSPQVLLKRKRIFHNSLIDITKDHHADFLSKMSPPIHVPPSSLTRWHPRFALDSVPDVEAAELPAPPLQKAQTAKQVLEAVKGKLPARVEQAMANVAVKSESSQPKASTSREQSKNASASGSSKPVNTALKGIPLSLLEKIRAKEAARTQAALTRDPKEDKKTEMIGRLPILIRSLRTFYVTEKKPSLPYQIVVEKLADSYASFISPAEVEVHLALLQELAPKWIQLIKIPRGKYVKIDKNMDISVIITELTNLAKSRR